MTRPTNTPLTAELSATAGDAQAIIDTALASAHPHELAPGSIHALVVPAGGRVETIDLDVDEYRDQPRRKTGTVAVHDASSFIAYVHKHGLPQSELWADITGHRLVAVLNAHAVETPGWSDLRATLRLTKTPAWAAWESLNRKLLGQVQFAEHVEDRIVDFVAPSGADMLELSQTFHATRSAKFDSSQRIKSGETQLRYHEDIEAKAGKKGDVAIPDSFELGLVPFEGSAAYKVTARLRYRIREDGLQIGYVLDRPEDVLKAAFLDIVTQVEEHCDQPVYRGTPTT